MLIHLNPSLAHTLSAAPYCFGKSSVHSLGSTEACLPHLLPFPISPLLQNPMIHDYSGGWRPCFNYFSAGTAPPLLFIGWLLEHLCYLPAASENLDQVPCQCCEVSGHSRPVPTAALSVQVHSMCSLIALLEVKAFKFKGDHVRTTWYRFLGRSFCGHLLFSHGCHVRSFCWYLLSSCDCHVRSFCHHLLKWKWIQSLNLLQRIAERTIRYKLCYHSKSYPRVILIDQRIVRIQTVYSQLIVIIQVTGEKEGLFSSANTFLTLWSTHIRTRTHIHIHQ